MNTYDSAFWLTTIGMLIGFGGLVLRTCYKSKCKNVKCLCLEVERDVNEEEKIDEIEIQQHGKEEKELV